MRSTSVIAFWLVILSVYSAAEAPVKITFGAPKPGKTFEESVVFPGRITNNSKKSVWLHLSSEGEPYNTPYIRPLKEDEWMSAPYGGYFVGQKEYELRPGASLSFETESSGGWYEFRIDVWVYDTRGGKRRWVKSAPVLFPSRTETKNSRPHQRPRNERR